MVVNYTDNRRIEQGALHDFEIDLDCTNEMDFQITTNINNRVLQGGVYWYIEGTEYGGKIDKIKPITKTKIIQHTGRNVRGLLKSKIVKPPIQSDYLVLSGTLQEVINQLLLLTGYSDLFTVSPNNIKVTNYQFDRYITLYDAICKLLSTFGKIPKFTWKARKVHIGVYESIDYSAEKEYNPNDFQMTITKIFNNVNHLVCLGSGELKNRMAVHLYADQQGNISKKQSIFGENEREVIYENVTVASVEELTEEGIKRFKELQTRDSFEVTIPDIELKIGDIIGGVEPTTGIRVSREIVNAIVKVNDHKISVEYMVGEDNTTSKSSSSGGSSSTSSGGGVYNLPPATKEKLGGVIVGDNINVDADGRISVTLTKGDKGDDGADGKSAYQIALDNGFEGTEEEWIASLQGKDGIDGQDGVSVVSVVQTTTSSEDGGTNVITVTLSDGTETTFNIKNGSNGSSITIDSAFSTTSTNPVQNKVVTAWLNDHSIHKLAIFGSVGNSACANTFASGSYEDVTSMLTNTYFSTRDSAYYSLAADGSIFVNKSGYHEIIFTGIYTAMDSTLVGRVKRMCIAKRTSGLSAALPTNSGLIANAERCSTWETQEVSWILYLSAGERISFLAQCEGATMSETAPTTIGYLGGYIRYLGA